MAEDSLGSSGATSVNRPPVGSPIHEIALHDAIANRALSILRPGPGRSLYLLVEPELGFGRPDAILLVLSATALATFRQRQLRLPSLTAARSLGEESHGVTVDHARALSRALRQAGWDDSALRVSGNMIHDALAIEAKMSEWRRAIRQATAYRLGTGRSAVLLPEPVARRVDQRNLAVHGVGLLAQSHNALEWITESPRREISMSSRAWLVELLLRGLDDGSAYSATASRKIVSASRKETSLAR